MDRLIVERIPLTMMYFVWYNGASLIVPSFRVDSAIIRIMRAYHERKGSGR